MDRMTSYFLLILLGFICFFVGLFRYLLIANTLNPVGFPFFLMGWGFGLVMVFGIKAAMYL